MKEKDIPLIYFIILISFASVGAVIPSASLMNIAIEFAIPKDETDSIISLFLLGYAVSQLIYAYLGNILGSIKVIKFGCYLAVLGFLLSAITTDINFLLLGRLISGIGSGCGLAVTFGLISHYYSCPTKAKQATSYTSSAFAVIPGVAIFIGGLINSYLSWKYIYYFMLVYSLVVLLIANCLSKAYQPKFKVKISISNFYEELKIYIYPAIIWGICGGIIYIFSTYLPIISMQEFNFSSLEFSLVYSLSMIGYFLGGIITAIFHKRHSSKIILSIGIIINLISAVIFVLSYMLLPQYTVCYFIPIFFLYVYFPMIFSTLIASSMQNVVNKTVASSMSAFICMTLSALITSGFSIFNISATIVTYITLFLCIILVLITYYYMLSSKVDAL